MQQTCKVYASHAHVTDVYLFKCASALICAKHESDLSPTLALGTAGNTVEN